MALFQYRRPMEEDFPLYEECFQNNEWCESYGDLTERSVDKASVARRIGFETYSNLERFVFFRDSVPLGFFHFQRSGPDQSRRCILAGGIRPSILNRGCGVFMCAVALDLAFKRFKFHKVSSTVLSRGQHSARMIERFGFVLEGTGRQHLFDLNKGRFVDVSFFGLLESDFPNRFTSTVLARTRYEPI